MQRATDKLFSLLFNILLIAIILFSSLQFVRSYNTYFFHLFFSLNKRLDFWNDVMHYCKIERWSIISGCDLFWSLARGACQYLQPTGVIAIMERKNVRCTWYRLSNITDYSFHTLSTFFTVKNVTLTWYR